MAKHRIRVGLHARNDANLPSPDYELVRLAKIETLKMMSFTDVGVHQRLRRENPDIEFIVRLYDDRLSRNSRPSPKQFVDKMVPIVSRLQPYTSKFEIHNEPNHVDGIEGWGSSDQNARAFRSWYLQVLPALKKACPWAQFGFPGLALNYPHRDLEWLDICRDAILASDWLGCHCYWQYGNMLDDHWGLRFKLYHQRFPKQRIEITEFGNSTPNLSADELAKQYAQYYQELNPYPYLGSASAFIASSPDPRWAPFAWRSEGGEMYPVVDAVGNMPRQAVEAIPSEPPSPAPEPESGRRFPQTGKTVRGAFLKFYNRYGPDICGYPITEEVREAGLVVQYFQRVALEEYEPGKLRLKLVGSEAWASRKIIAQLKAWIERLERGESGAGPAKPIVQDIADQLPTHPEKRFSRRPRSAIKRLVIHHTATSSRITPHRVAEHLVEEADRAGMIFHYFVAADGTLYETNRLETVTDHAYGQSWESAGICFPGNFTSDVPTADQVQAGGELCAWLLDDLDLSLENIVGLREIERTESPGRQWLSGARWKDDLLAATQAALEAGDEDTQPESGKVSRPPIQTVIDELDRHETKMYNIRPRTDIEALVIHHSAVPPTVGPVQIASYHVNSLDWPGVGYHFLVSAEGVIYQGNAVETVSYHAAKVNARGVGICFLGNFNQEIPPSDQLRAGSHLVAWLMQELNIALDDVKGHKEFMATACPGKQWLRNERWKDLLRQEIGRVQEGAT